MKKNLTITETNVINVISYILSLMKKKSVDCNIETCAELILIARILNQRFNITDGLNIEQDPSLILAKKEIIIKVENDEYYDHIIHMFNQYEQHRINKLN